MKKQTLPLNEKNKHCLSMKEQQHCLSKKKTNPAF